VRTLFRAIFRPACFACPAKTPHSITSSPRRPPSFHTTYARTNGRSSFGSNRLPIGFHASHSPPNRSKIGSGSPFNRAGLHAAEETKDCRHQDRDRHSAEHSIDRRTRRLLLHPVAIPFQFLPDHDGPKQFLISLHRNHWLQKGLSIPRTSKGRRYS